MGRIGYENFTTACLPVTYDQNRADAGLPPWVSDNDQHFLDSEVTETTTSEDKR